MAGQDPLGFPVCTEHLIIGGIYYDRVNDTYDYPIDPDCYWTDPYPCIYQMKGIIGSRFCLKFGNQKTVVVIFLTS